MFCLCHEIGRNRIKEKKPFYLLLSITQFISKKKKIHVLLHLIDLLISFFHENSTEFRLFFLIF